MRTVLIVEDDRDEREALAVALDHCGYQVATACHGRDAVDQLLRADVSPSLIVLDWMMPVMSGLDFLLYQAAHHRLRGIPVLILSAVDRVQGFADAGVAAVLTKPVRLRTLIDVVDRLCDLPPRPPGALDGFGRRSTTPVSSQTAPTRAISSRRRSRRRPGRAGWRPAPPAGRARGGR
jgi:DNA-binding response OmpR family regulator